MTSRVALVTGGTGGIGTAIVKALASKGHRVATNFRNDWSTVHMVNLRNVANALRNAATAARTNATEQDNASNK